MKKKIDVIQLLRGVSALLICCFHMRGTLNGTSYRLGDVLFESGSLVTVLFFMISGFIVVITNQNSEASLEYARNFLFKRVVRIVPLYYLLTLLLVIGLGNVSVFIVRHPDLLAKSLLFAPTGLKTVGASYGMPIIKVGWTLNYEMFFYLLVAISFFFKKKKWSFLIVGTLFLVYGVPLLIKGYVVSSPLSNYGFIHPYLSMVTNVLMLSFIVGVVVGLVYASDFKISSIHFANVLMVISVALFALLYFNAFNNVSYYLTIMIEGFLLLGLLMRDKVLSIPISKHLVLLGDMSYSVYLVHPLVIIFMTRAFRFVGLGSLLATPLFFFIVIVIVLLLSYATFMLIEMRLSGWIIAKFLPSKKTIMPLKYR